MEREFPKNVKQIGNVCDEPKIYVEDYVDTYLNQLKEKASEDPVAAVLTGEMLSMNGQDVVYVAGALQIQKVETEGIDIIIRDETWKLLEEEKKTFFSGQDIIGWCLIERGKPISLRRGIVQIHKKLFPKDNTVFIWRDAVEAEEVFYANKFGELMQMGGHYIFYEKNPSMQNYMINMRKKIGVTPSEVVEDRAAKDFRSTVREKIEYKEQRQSSKFVYAMSVALVVIVLAIGISTVNNYDKMESVQDSLAVLSQAVSQPEAETAKIDEEGQADQKEQISEEKERQSSENVQDTEEMTGDGRQQSSEAIQKAEEEAAEKISPADAQAGSGDYYVVQKGDTLDGISIKVYGSRSHVDAICRMNGLADGNLIIIGQKILLP